MVAQQSLLSRHDHGVVSPIISTQSFNYSPLHLVASLQVPQRHAPLTNLQLVSKCEALRGTGNLQTQCKHSANFTSFPSRCRCACNPETMYEQDRGGKRICMSIIQTDF